MERKVRDSCGNSESKETPQAQVRRGGSWSARGKRVPEVEINVQICTSKKIDKPLVIIQGVLITTLFFYYRLIVPWYVLG
ncbi:hypothetical protein KEH51_00180 [[Brevibacterium] frigoritolerans]|uniref:Uncharacterized protein n=1 Tax=Peribacillus frigoritolerans TaxID=450367 RepID=A0A941FNY6_9BACI|nr:hypothetical protein [Peribacillus frigoritolerans]